MRNDGPKRAFRLPAWGRRRIREAVDEELEFHLERVVAELMDSGVPPDEARERAVAEFGDLQTTRDYCTEQGIRRTSGRARMWRMEEVSQDLKYGFRTLAKNPGYALVIALTLAVGIGANVSIFSLLNPYLVRPLPYQAPEELVQLAQWDPVQQWEARHSLPQLADYREQSRAFTDLGAYYYGTANVTGDAGAERLLISYVTDNMMDVLGTEPLLGRTFAEGEQRPGSSVVMLDHGVWERRYGADPSVLGSTIRVDGALRTVVGIMPPDFVFPFNEVKLWAPMEELPSEVARGNDYMLIVGRLAPGWTEERATAEMNQIHGELASLYPDADGSYERITVTPIREALNFAWDGLRWGAVILGVAMGFLLLIACVNVAGLMLARAATRHREVAIRAAVGASRTRIIRQLFVESVLLSLAGGVLGVVLARVAMDALGATLPDAIFRVGEPTIDGIVLAFSLVVTLATPFLFGLLPAFKSARPDLAAVLKSGTLSRGPRSMRARRALVVTQIAFALVLVAGTGLMVRSFLALNGEDLGFDPDQVLAVESRPGEADFPQREDVNAFYDNLLNAVRAVPGVRSVATTVPLAMNHELINTGFSAVAASGTPVDEWPRAMYFRVSEEYFDAMDIELLQGRVFDESDREASTPSIIVSEGAAERFWAGQDPVGQTILLSNTDPPQEGLVVGVVEDVEEEGFESVFGAQLYRPASQAYTRGRYIVVGIDADPAAVMGAVGQAFRQAGPTVPVLLRRMQAVVDENTMGWRIPSILLGIFGVIAVGLASLGIYGIIAYSVAQRRMELGIRIALGASRGQVRSRVLAEGARLAGTGLLVGLLLAFGAGQLLASRLYGIGPMDPVTYGAAAALFATVALVAAARPAVQASRTEPVRILKAE